MSEWGDMTVGSGLWCLTPLLFQYKAELIIISLKINLFSPRYSWTIPTITHSLTHSLTRYTVSDYPVLPSKVFPHNDVNIKISSVDNWTFSGQIESVWTYICTTHFVLYIRSCLLRELTTSQLVAIATRSDTGSHNRLDLIQSLVPTHYVCNG